MSRELHRGRQRGPLGSVGSFSDATALAFELSSQFRYAHTAVMLDDDGNICDMTIYADRSLHTVDTALDWAMCFTFNDEVSSKMLIISVGDESTDGPLREDDIRIFEKAREVFRKRYVEVIDWMRCDADNARSTAMAISGSDPWQRHEAADA
jgi:hypothetical protein